MKKILKRELSLILALIMLITNCLTTAASAMDQGNVAKVPGSRLGGEALGDAESIVYFGTVGFDVAEGGKVYSIPVYRDGDTSQTETVLLHSIDVSALYGKDYEIIGGEIEEGSGEETLLYQLFAENEAADEPAVISYSYDDETNTFEESDVIIEPEVSSDAGLLSEIIEDEDYESDVVLPVEASEQNEEKNGTASPSEAAEERPEIAEDTTEAPAPAAEAELPEELSLAEIKELVTGEEVRETYETEARDFAKEVSEQLMPQYLAAMAYSCEKEIRFLPGETEKELKIRILDDDQSEGTEVFSIAIIAAEYSEVREPQSVTVSITDDEELILSKVSFEKGSYDIVNGTASVTVVREDAPQSFAAVSIEAMDEETGEKTAVGQVTFSPYATEATAEIALENDAVLQLTAFEGCDAGETLLAAATGRKEDFNITVNNVKYLVRRDAGSSQYGTIYDTNFTPYLEVGKYIFPNDMAHGGQFSYYTGGDDAEV